VKKKEKNDMKRTIAALLVLGLVGIMSPLSVSASPPVAADLPPHGGWYGKYPLVGINQYLPWTGWQPLPPGSGIELSPSSPVRLDYRADQPVESYGVTTGSVFWRLWFSAAEKYHQWNWPVTWSYGVSGTQTYSVTGQCSGWPEEWEIGEIEFREGEELGEFSWAYPGDNWREAESYPIPGLLTSEISIFVRFKAGEGGRIGVSPGPQFNMGTHSGLVVIATPTPTVTPIPTPTSTLTPAPTLTPTPTITLTPTSILFLPLVWW